MSEILEMHKQEAERNWQARCEANREIGSLQHQVETLTDQNERLKKAREALLVKIDIYESIPITCEDCATPIQLGEANIRVEADKQAADLLCDKCFLERVTEDAPYHNPNHDAFGKGDWRHII